MIFGDGFGGCDVDDAGAGAFGEAGDEGFELRREVVFVLVVDLDCGFAPGTVKNLFGCDEGDFLVVAVYELQNAGEGFRRMLAGEFAQIAVALGASRRVSADAFRKRFEVCEPLRCTVTVSCGICNLLKHV